MGLQSYKGLMKTIYRVSDRGYPKNKLPLVNNENCFVNFCANFLRCDLSELVLIQDNCNSSTILNFDKIIKKINVGTDPIVMQTNVGNASSYVVALNYAINNFKDDEIVYFVEGDFIHDKNSMQILEEGFKLIGTEVDYVTLYAHPDKEMPENIIPEYIFRSQNCYWRSCISTVMTCATKVKTLKEDLSVITKWTAGKHPEDHSMFSELRSSGRVLVSSIPGYSTHGETSWLSPHKDWNLILANSIL